MTERTKVIEDFEGIAERLKEIRRERGEVIPGEIGIAGPSGNPTAPPPSDEGWYCAELVRLARSRQAVVDPVTGHISWGAE